MIPHVNPKSPTFFDTLKPGCFALVRTGRADVTQVNWSQPFETPLYVQKDGRGRTCCLTLQDQDWAEYDPRHHAEGPRELVAESYHLEILEVRA